MTLQIGLLDFQKERSFTTGAYIVSWSFWKTLVVSLVLYTYLVRYLASYCLVKIPQSTILLIIIDLIAMIMITTTLSDKNKLQRKIILQKRHGQNRLNISTFLGIKRCLILQQYSFASSNFVLTHAKSALISCWTKRIRKWHEVQIFEAQLRLEAKLKHC